MFVPHASEIWTKSNGPNYTKFWAFWQKSKFFKTIFDKALMLFWKAFNFQTTIFKCSQNYNSPTRVTRLKVATNMTAPISTRDSDSRLKTCISKPTCNTEKCSIDLVFTTARSRCTLLWILSLSHCKSLTGGSPTSLWSAKWTTWICLHIEGWVR